MNIFYHENISQRELADLLFVSESNVAQIIKRLEKKGFIYRELDSNNKSKKVLKLTKKGKFTVFSLLKVIYEGETKLLDKYGEEDIKKFKQMLYDYSNIAARDRADIQYIELDGSTGKNFGLLIIDELTRRRFATGTGNSRENKVDRARRVSADIQKNGIFLIGKNRTGFTKKWAMEFLEKITAYPNEAIHDDCVVAFTGGYEKIVSEAQTRRVNVDKWYST